MSPRPQPLAPILAAVALIAGVLQVMATVMLGLASLEELRIAAAEGARLYLLGALATVIGLVVVWLLRKRVLVAAVVLLVWQAAVLWPLHARTSSLGLAFHGEYVLHHFTGLVAAATCIAIASGWIRRRSLGTPRLVPAALAIAGTLALVLCHVAEQPSMGAHLWPWLERGGTLALLLAWASALGLLWRHLGPSRLRLVAVVLLLPFVVRVAFAWPEGLAGASVVEAGRPVLMFAMVVAAVTTFFAFMPPLAAGIRVLVLSFSGMATLMLYWFYARGFGELEAGLGGLAQSMFAFSLPYPTYVSLPEKLVVLLGLFALFASAYSGLVSPGHRVRGVALSLLVVTGLGLSTPPLVLMVSAASLLWIDSLVGASPGGGERRAPKQPMRALLDGVAVRLGLGEVVALESGRRQLLALRGEVDELAVDLRARPVAGDGWDLVVVVGVLGRSRPELSLVPEPGDEGHRPAHLLARTHRARGLVRQLELLDDTLFDTLVGLTTARVELWDAGSRVRLGGDLGELDDERLAALVRELAARE